MRYARQHAQTHVAERRRRLAHEAARLIAESGIRDYRQAKRKAAHRLGIADDASLPRNREIEEALREYQRLFAGPSHTDMLQARRQAALQALEFFESFAPRLVGPVLDGTADTHSPVQLHLHCDDQEAVGHFLQEHRIPTDLRMRRLRMDRTHTADVPAWLFVADGIDFDLVVLPRRALRQAPLSIVNERPMSRASATQLAQLLADTPQSG